MASLAIAIYRGGSHGLAAQLRLFHRESIRPMDGRSIRRQCEDPGAALHFSLALDMRAPSQRGGPESVAQLAGVGAAAVCPLVGDMVGLSKLDAPERHPVP